MSYSCSAQPVCPQDVTVVCCSRDGGGSCTVEISRYSDIALGTRYTENESGISDG